MLFQNSQSTFESLFSEEKQFDANSFGVWILAGMPSYLINLLEILDRCNAFDITYNLLEQNPIIQKVESLYLQFSTEDKMKKFASADFLIPVLTNDPERSEYFRQSPPKGTRTNFFITDISKTSISHINADKNGAYLKSRNINKFYYCDNDQTSIVHEDISGKFYCNGRLSQNSYKKVYIPSDKIVKLSRTYTKSKSFSSKYQIQQVTLLVPLLRISTKL